MSFTQADAPSADSVRSALYRLMGETVPHMVWTARPDGRLDFFNSRVFEYTGMGPGELEGWGWRPVVHPQDWPPCLERWTRSLASGEPYEIEYRLRRSDGAYRWHLGAARPLRDAQGRILKWFGTCTDIDDRKRAAAVLEQQVAERARALRASEARLRAIIDNQPECLKLLDAEGRLLEMNPAGLRMIEADDPAALVGRDVSELVVPENRDAFRALTARACRGEQGSLQFEMVGLKGRRRTLETHAVPFRDEARGETLALCMTRDITAQMAAQRAQRESETRYRALVETTHDAILVRQGERYVFANPAALRLYGVERAEDLLGRSMFEFVDPRDAALARERMRLMSTGRDRLEPVEMRIRRPDGVSVEVEAAAARMSFGGEPAVLAVLHDISARKQAEHRERQHAAAARRLLERLFRVQEDERRRIAVELHDVLGQQLAALGIGLNIIRHETEVLPGDKLDARLDHLTGLLEGTIDEIRRIVRDLRPPILDDHGLVPALHWLAQRFSKDGGPRVVVVGDETAARLPPPAELALFRIAQEALTNATRHSAASTVRISIAANADTVRLAIEDDGGGYARAELAAVAAAEAGSLGITAMRERAQALGGTLRIDSGAAGLRVVAEVPRTDVDPRHSG
jgi:PAS domain S-box-containing protein